MFGTDTLRNCSSFKMQAEWVILPFLWEPFSLRASGRLPAGVWRPSRMGVSGATFLDLLSSLVSLLQVGVALRDRKHSKSGPPAHPSILHLPFKAYEERRSVQLA